MKRRRLIFLLLWILSLVAVSFYGGAVSYGLFWGLTLVPVISLIYLILFFSQFKIYQEIQSRNIVCKQAMPYYFTLPNETFYSFAGLNVRMFSGFSYVTDIPEDEEYELLPGDSHTYHTNLVCKYRGEYEVGVKEIVVTDFFRLFRMRYRIHGTIKALVYPRMIQKKELSSIKDIIDVSNLQSEINKTETDVITRDYIPGDSLKYIHWKVSAREQKLKTRNLLGERKQGILLLYDTKRFSPKEEAYIPLESQILETVLALSYHFGEKGIPFTLLCGQNGVKKLEAEGISGLDYVYRETCQVRFDEREDGEALLARVVQERLHLHARSLIMVAHKVSDGLMRQLQEFAVEGLPVVLYLVTDEDAEKYIRQSNSRLKIVVLPVDGDLEELL